MLKKLLLSLAVVCWPSYSYSESIAPYYGYTGNAITDQSLAWSMGNVVPEAPGTDIENIIYSYRIDKETGDLVKVSIYNKNADGTGYIFRETDEWRPGSLSGTQINKVVPLGRIHKDQFGDGGIDIDGPGSVYDTSVVYTYRIDPCYNPQFDPNCPGYEIPSVALIEINLDDLYNVMNDESVDLDRKTALEQNEENIDEAERKKKEEEEERKRKYRLEKSMSATDAAALFAETQRIAQMTNIMDAAIADQYLGVDIPGGEYQDTIQLADGNLPDSRNGLRNGLAQQLLHQQMVRSQYTTNNLTGEQ